MLETGRGPDLPKEPLGAKHRAEFGAQDPDGDLAPVLQVIGLIDRGHPADAQLAGKAVAVGSGLGRSRCSPGRWDSRPWAGRPRVRSRKRTGSNPIDVESGRWYLDFPR